MTPAGDTSAEPPGDLVSGPPAALVAGGSRGIGLAVAHLLASEGYGVTLVARRRPALEEAVDGLRALGVDAHGVIGDLGNEGAIGDMLDFHADRFGRLDVLVVSAGSGRPGALGALTGDDLRRMVAVNLEGPALLISAAMPFLRRAGAAHRRALVFVIASMAARWPVAGFTGYSATKAALTSLARSVNAEAEGDGIRACALCPAYVDTEMSAWTAGTIPPETMLQAGDVAEAVRFVLRLSPNAVVDDITIRRAGAGPLAP